MLDRLFSQLAGYIDQYAILPVLYHFGWMEWDDLSFDWALICVYGLFAVVVTYVHLYTMMMMGPIANSLAKIDRDLLEAARDAGASRWQTMRNVVIPLSRTGIALGSILVFTQVMGDYFVVRQMSGGQSASIVSMLSTEIQAMQYPPASANAMVLVVFVAILVAVMMKIVDVRKELVK